MRIDKTSKLEKAAGDSLVYAMDAICLDTQDEGKPVAVATNGRVLAVIPVELEDGDKAGLIPLVALKEARRGAGRGDTARIEAGDTVRAWGKAGPVTYERPDFGKFPDWRDVVKDQQDGVSICLNAKLLLNLAEAMGTDSVRVTLAKKDGPNQPFKVEPLNSNILGAHGVLMPISNQ